MHGTQDAATYIHIMSETVERIGKTQMPACGSETFKCFTSNGRGECSTQ